MPSHTDKDRPYEDWEAVMRELLHGHAEQQRLAAFKLNRLISGVLRRLGAWRYQADWEDVRQIVVLKLVRRYRTPPLPNPHAFVKYVTQTTRNEFFDFLRAQSDKPEVPEPPENASAPVDWATRFSIQACLEQLPAELREVVEARYVEDLTLARAAERLGMALATIKRRLTEAMEHLRKCLADHVPERYSLGQE